MKLKNKFSCEEHLDIAFDDFLVECETFPNLEEYSEEKCDYCKKESKYKLEGTLEETI